MAALGGLALQIDRDFDQPMLETVRGAGYILRDPSGD